MLFEPHSRLATWHAYVRWQGAVLFVPQLATWELANMTTGVMAMSVGEDERTFQLIAADDALAGHLSTCSPRPMAYRDDDHVRFDRQ